MGTAHQDQVPGGVDEWVSPWGATVPPTPGGGGGRGGGGGGGYGGSTGGVVPPGIIEAPYLPLVPENAICFSGASIIPVTDTGVLASCTITGPVESMNEVSTSWVVDITEAPQDRTNFITRIRSQPSGPTLSAFNDALAAQGLRMIALGYVVEVTKFKTTSTGYAIIQMNADRTWVDQNGGIDAVRILRQGEDGLVQILDTQFLGSDQNAGKVVFRGFSPNGLSVFAFVTVENMSATVSTTPVTPQTTATPPVSGPTPCRILGIPCIVVAVIIAAAILVLVIWRIRTRRQNESE